ncbi:hypothetical protein EI983_15125 [Roseovarius faecimaris]|uniref:Uncharacterized protein n=1 Tax=Roseovarius faecimaris TaxID=2494550 RepID=A0A6I6IVJ2_9RHOB|nr:hypothetical protein [Roseovarius faecimaris]QGX99527.1 hypothetical protein EI983_15125 [Roseovarius faecimaris]
MTTVITRLFDEQEARKAVEKLLDRRLPRRAIDLIPAPPGRAKTDLKARMSRAGVHDSAIDAYAEALKKGRALLVVRATHVPLTAATITRTELAKRKAIPVKGITDDYYMPDGPDHAPNILKDHPLFLTMRIDRSRYEGRPISEGLGLRLLSPRRDRRSAIGGSRHVSRAFWPMPLISRKERNSSVIRGGRFVSRGFWPMPLVTRTERSNKTFRGLTLSRLLHWPTRV